MPAQPGYFVINAAPPMKADGDWQTFRRPVVGWLSIEDPSGCPSAARIFLLRKG
jgi:hypothetical protein